MDGAQVYLDGTVVERRSLALLALPQACLFQPPAALPLDPSELDAPVASRSVPRFLRPGRRAMRAQAPMEVRLRRRGERRRFLTPRRSGKRPRLKALAVQCIAVVLAGLLAACDQGQKADHPGKKTYERYCFTCHASGVAGAPSLDDGEAWEPRLDRGRDALLQSVVRGMPPGMPPMGLCSACTDEQLLESIDYMIESITTSE